MITKNNVSLSSQFPIHIYPLIDLYDKSCIYGYIISDGISPSEFQQAITDAKFTQEHQDWCVQDILDEISKYYDFVFIDFETNKEYQGVMI